MEQPQGMWQLGRQPLRRTGVVDSTGRAGGGRGCYEDSAGWSVLLISVLSPSGEQCGGCRRSNTTDRPHSFQVILTDRPSLELSADNEEDMADWMQYFCQAVSKGVSRGLAAGVGRWTPPSPGAPLGPASMALPIIGNPVPQDGKAQPEHSQGGDVEGTRE